MTEQTTSQCGCLCHSTGYRTVLTSNPPQDCCQCTPLIVNNISRFNETLSLCKHGVPVKFSCDICEIEKLKKIGEQTFVKRIEQIEKHMEHIPNFAVISDLEDRMATEIEILKGFNQETQKGFNRLSERIEALELLSKKLQDRIYSDLVQKINAGMVFEKINYPDFRKRIEKLENEELDKHSIRLGALEKTVFIDNEKRIEVLETAKVNLVRYEVLSEILARIEALEKQLSEIKSSSHDKEPLFCRACHVKIKEYF